MVREGTHRGTQGSGDCLRSGAPGARGSELTGDSRATRGRRFRREIMVRLFRSWGRTTLSRVPADAEEIALRKTLRAQNWGSIYESKYFTHRWRTISPVDVRLATSQRRLRGGYRG